VQIGKAECRKVQANKNYRCDRNGSPLTFFGGRKIARKKFGLKEMPVSPSIVDLVAGKRILAHRIRR
jgi:hypothetical protein